jgi:hypothetical protein
VSIAADNEQVKRWGWEYKSVVTTGYGATIARIEGGFHDEAHKIHGQDGVDELQDDGKGDIMHVEGR